MLLLLNAHHDQIPFMLPVPAADAFWEPLMDTAQFPGHLSETKGGAQYEMHGRSMALLRLSTSGLVCSSARNLKFRYRTLDKTEFVTDIALRWTNSNKPGSGTCPACNWVFYAPPGALDGQPRLLGRLEDGLPRPSGSFLDGLGRPSSTAEFASLVLP